MFPNQIVASHCHVNCGSDTYCGGKLQHMPIVEVKWGLNQPAYITSWGQWDVCFYPFRKRRSAKHGSYLKSNKPQQKQNNVAPIFLTLPTWQNEILASSLQHTNTAMLLLFLLAHAANSLHLTISWAASFRLI